MSILYVVATPIGNLEDISLRAIRVLGEVDFVLCEDTRVTAKLLSHYKINTRTISFHEHSDDKKLSQIISWLENNKSIAMVSDAGTPGISDPGGKLIQAVVEKFGDSVKIEVVPGPSAVTAALSISGIPTNKFLFLGFPPHKKGRQTFLEKIFSSEYPVVVYESKHRILKFLNEVSLANEVVLEKNKTLNKKERKIPLSSVVVCRELSKMHETVYRGEIEDISNKIKSSNNDQKGEFVVILGR